MIYIFLADGFEIIEALAPADMLTRAGLDVTTVGVTGSMVKSSCGISVKSEILIEDIDLSKAEMIILPGGMPGTINLENSDLVQNAISYAVDNDLYIGAICAAPSILGHRGLLNSVKATCFPGFEDSMPDDSYTGAPVELSGRIITARGAGVCIPFGLKCVEALKDIETADKINKSIQSIH